jgi:hypothetical protein
VRLAYFGFEPAHVIVTLPGAVAVSALPPASRPSSWRIRRQGPSSDGPPRPLHEGARPPRQRINLKKTGLPAHILFKWIHVVFANLKRWALGTFHGLREKHLDAYLNEFVFRWNRRRHLQSAMDTMLGIGRRIGRVTYRGIVGDTTQWKKEHIDDILDMWHPNKQQIVSDPASFYRVHRLDVMENLVWWSTASRRSIRNMFREFGWDFDGVREFEERRKYVRRKRPNPTFSTGNVADRFCGW